ncbi:uncharacterized protein [Choristoneura fumiferana]|uniref:uncharacterized protein n=1 Tax=Choristoneura fumiferana TaxID=7141 RepID=UPI003D15B528
MEPQQSQDIASAADHQVKEELVALSADVKVKHEPQVIDEHQQLQNTTLLGCCGNDCQPALVKSVQIPDMAITVRVQVKHESDIDFGPEPVADAVLCEDPNWAKHGLKLLQNPKVHSGVEVWASSCDLGVMDENALQQVVDGCYVKLQRLRLLWCDVCGQVSQKTSQLVAHIIDHHVGDDTDQSDKDVEADDYHDSDSSDNLKLYPCNICHEQFAFKCHMKIHKLKHWGREPFTCDICQKDFAKKSNLRKHMHSHLKRQVADIREPIPCEVCNKMFTNRLKLMTHVRRHSHPKLFACKRCPKRFTRKETLVVHKRVHQSMKPYSCDVCKKIFV